MAVRGIRRIRIALVASVASLAGCYTMQPAIGAPELGTAVAFDINDTGRVALGGSMGPEIAQVEGRLVQREATDYVLSVSSVRLLRGGEQVWRGERVRIKPEYVSSSYEKRFSKGRTVAISAIGVGAAAYLVTRSLLGAGSVDNSNTPPDTNHTQRLPRHQAHVGVRINLYGVLHAMHH